MQVSAGHEAFNRRSRALRCGNLRQRGGRQRSKKHGPEPDVGEDETTWALSGDAQRCKLPHFGVALII